MVTVRVTLPTCSIFCFGGACAGVAAAATWLQSRHSKSARNSNNEGEPDCLARGLYAAAPLSAATLTRVGANVAGDAQQTQQQTCIQA